MQGTPQAAPAAAAPPSPIPAARRARRRPQPSRRVRRPSGPVALAIGMLLGSTFCGFEPFEIWCNEAMAHLAACCPSSIPSSTPARTRAPSSAAAALPSPWIGRSRSLARPARRSSRAVPAGPLRPAAPRGLGHDRRAPPAPRAAGRRRAAGPGAILRAGQRPEPGAGRQPRPRHPVRALLGAAFGPARGTLSGLRLTGTSLDLSYDLLPASLRGTGGVCFALTPAWFRTPAGLDYRAWRASIAILARAGPVRAGLGGGISYTTFETASSGTLDTTNLFLRAYLGIESRPAGTGLPLPGAGGGR